MKIFYMTPLKRTERYIAFLNHLGNIITRCVYLEDVNFSLEGFCSTYSLLRIINLVFCSARVNDIYILIIFFIMYFKKLQIIH